MKQLHEGVFDDDIDVVVAMNNKDEK